DLTEEVQEVSKSARESGETSALIYANNPFGYFNVVTETIQKVVLAARDVNSNDPQFPEGFKYIEKLSDVKEEIK
ncbi:hypothetical protein CN514_05580, partial [Bacillus sp. AFS001701]|uniref:hypothetical protein n=1 Tax=Bacillus sp. AFS001701 TaxID=2033480 RepID=UPI000BFADD96